jgi:hypothetical protein
MKTLPDTHVLLWWLDGDERLPEACRGVIGDPKNTIFFGIRRFWWRSQKQVPSPYCLSGLQPGTLRVPINAGALGIATAFRASCHERWPRCYRSLPYEAFFEGWETLAIAASILLYIFLASS